jgi:hypothetical protein
MSAGEHQVAACHGRHLYEVLARTEGRTVAREYDDIGGVVVSSAVKLVRDRAVESVIEGISCVWSVECEEGDRSVMVRSKHGKYRSG